MASNASVVTVRPRRAAPILVCRKCLAGVGGGKKLKRALKSEVKRQSAERSIKRPRIVLTDCLGICPRRAVTVGSAATLKRGEYLLLDRNSVALATAILMPPEKTS